MKTAISIPDPIFAKAEITAKKLKMTRSELYVTALSHYLEESNENEVTAALNRIYTDDSNSNIDLKLKHAQLEVLRREKW